LATRKIFNAERLCNINESFKLIRFGLNTKPTAEMPRFIDSVKEALRDRIIWAIMGVGALTTLTAPWLSKTEVFDFVGLWKGLSIFVAVFLIIALNAANDYMKDKQFGELLASIKDESVTVLRGKQGATQSVSGEELVVGDCLLLESGSRVPADCLLVEGDGVVVDTSYYAGLNGTADPRKSKTPVNGENIHSNPDCFLLSQSIVVEGSGKAIVCAVGDRSNRARVVPERMGITDQVTPLQERLTNLGQHFSLYGLYSAAAILAALLINFVITTSTSDSQDPKDAITNFLSIFTTALLIVVVAVPEGLPLSINISLAYSTKEMKKHKILVKRLESMEIMGTI
jgi:Ca2+-transporting ATPase